MVTDSRVSKPNASARLRHLVVAFGCVVLVLAPGFFVSDYLAGLLGLTFLYAIIAVSTDVIWGYAGIVTFASGAMFGIGAYVLGIILVRIPISALGIAGAIVAGILCAAVISIVIGWFVFYSRIRVSAFYIAIVTLGITLVLNRVALYGGTLTGGSNGLSGFRSVTISNQAWYVLLGGLFLLVVLSAAWIVRSDFGLLLRAVRDNETRCRYLGISTPLVKTITFAGANAVIALAGSVYALVTSLVTPSLLGLTFTTDIVIWVILGGRGTIFGPALAAIALGVATPFLNTTIPLIWRGVLGLVFVLAVIFAPRGLFAPGGDRFRDYWNGILGRWRVLPEEPKYDDESGGLGATFQPLRLEERDGRGAREVLVAGGVSKYFGKLKAVDQVNLSTSRGELVSIVGPNGAGKTSFTRCLVDGMERSAGDVKICGHSVNRATPEAIVAMGVARKFQAPNVFETLSVAECLRIASWRGKIPGVRLRHGRTRLPAGAVEVVEALGLRPLWNRRAGTLSHGQKQALEIAMVLTLQPDLLILDEPTAGLTTHERSKVATILKSLASRNEVSIILIEHDFDFVKSVSSRMVVLIGGRVAVDGTVEQVQGSEVVRNAYLGGARG